MSLRRSPRTWPITVSEPPRPPYTSAVSNSVIPASSALWMTLARAFQVHPLPEIVAAEPHQRDPQAGRPKIAQDHDRSLIPVEPERSHAHSPETIGLSMREKPASHAASRFAWRSATGIVPDRERPRTTRTRSHHRPEGKMLHPLRATARFIDQKIGWNRIGLALSLAIIGFAIFVLYRMLRGIEFSERGRGAEGDRSDGRRARRAVRRGRLFHAHLLRPVRAAHDRREPRALPHRGARRASPAIRSATISGRACSPAARCATASIRPGG